MKSFLKKRKLNIICSFSAIVFAWLVWIIAFFAVSNEYVVPDFFTTIKEFFLLFISARFWLGFAMTVIRTLLSAVLSLVVASVLAALSIAFKVAREFLKPLVAIVRTLPTLAATLIILLWTNPTVAPVVVAFLVLFPMFYSQILTAASGVENELLQMAKVYKIDTRTTLFKIYIPQILPPTVEQLGANISFALKIVISAEVLANTLNSIGGLMQNARLTPDMPTLAALTILCIIVGFAFDIGFSQFERIFSKWRAK